MKSTLPYDEDPAQDLDPFASTMSWTEHFYELRRRVMWCTAVFLIGTCISYFFAASIFGWLAQPFKDLHTLQSEPTFIYTHLAEAFSTYLNIACWGGLTLCLPFILIHTWKFIRPGLYHHERFITASILIVSPLLFLFGAAFAYYVVLPAAWQFLLHFQHHFGDMSLVFMPKMDEYLSFILKILFSFGCCFQLPIVCFGLCWLGILTTQQLKQGRRYAIVGIFILAGIATPPDIFSQFALALPLLILYEISIRCSEWLAKFQ